MTVANNDFSHAPAGFGPWRIQPRRAERPAVQDRVERGLNVALATLMLIFFAPMMLLAAAITAGSDGGPALFGHTRIGKNGRRFKCLKFRSMAVDAEARLQELLTSDPQARAEWELDHKLRNDPRVTAWGAFMRVTSLDELPQLINVLRGDMSLVGPRPIVEAEASRYGRYFRYYTSVRPGITGLWQVSGRSDTSYRRRVAMDVTYTRTKSLAFDLQILVMTVKAVLARKGSY